MKKFILTAVSLILGIIILWIAINASGLKNILEIIQTINWTWLIAVPILFSLVFILDTWRWQIILKTDNYRVSLWRLLLSKLAGFSVNYITPMMYVGGEWAQAYVLKKDTQIALTKGASTIIIDKAIEALMVLVFFIFCGALIFWRLDGLVYTILAWLMILISILTLGLFILQVKRGKKFFVPLICFFKIHKLNFIGKRLQRIEILETDIYNFFKTKTSSLLKACGITLLSKITYLSLFFCLLSALNHRIDFVLLLILRALSIIVSLVPIPAALGVYEGSFGFAFNAIGLDSSAGITFSLIIRALYVFWTALGFIYISNFGIKLFFQSKKEKNV